MQSAAGFLFILLLQKIERFFFLMDGARVNRMLMGSSGRPPSMIYDDLNMTASHDVTFQDGKLLENESSHHCLTLSDTV